MLPSHRSIYYVDIGLFLALAIPGLNKILIELLFSFGSYDINAFGEAAWTMILSLTGLFGVLGLGFSCLRIALAETRDTVLISFLVKLAASGWLLCMYCGGMSPAFGALAAIDFVSALVLLGAYVRHT